MIKLVRSFGTRILSDIEPVTVRKWFGAPESAKLHDQFEYVIEKGENTQKRGKIWRLQHQLKDRLSTTSLKIKHSLSEKSMDCSSKPPFRGEKENWGSWFG